MTELKHTQVYPIVTNFVSSRLTDVTSLLHSATPFCAASEKSGAIMLTVKSSCSSGDVHKL